MNFFGRDLSRPECVLCLESGDTFVSNWDGGVTRIEPDVAAEDNWVNTTNDAADMTLLKQAPSWYMGANVEGKKRRLLAYVGGVNVYRELCDEAKAKDYETFELV